MVGRNAYAGRCSFSTHSVRRSASRAAQRTVMVKTSAAVTSSSAPPQSSAQVVRVVRPPCGSDTWSTATIESPKVVVTSTAGAVVVVVMPGIGGG
jgi:hypothetical protein